MWLRILRVCRHVVCFIKSIILNRTANFDNFIVFTNCPQELSPFGTSCFFLHSGLFHVDQLPRKIVITAIKKCVYCFGQFGIQCGEVWLNTLINSNVAIGFSTAVIQL